MGLTWKLDEGGLSILVEETASKENRAINFRFYLRPFQEDGLMSGDITVCGRAAFVRYDRKGDLAEYH